jgi:hypothetical protein
MKEASQSASLVPPRLGPFGGRISGLVSGCGLKPFRRWGEEEFQLVSLMTLTLTRTLNLTAGVGGSKSPFG